MAASKEYSKSDLDAGIDELLQAVTLRNAIKRYSQAQHDFVIIYGQKRREVHKSVMELNSDVLAKIVQGAFKEAQSAELTLTADMPVTVDAMIDWMYTFTYTIPSYHQSKPLTFLAHLVVLADQWNIVGLKSHAGGHLARLLKSSNTIDLEDLIEALEIAYAAEIATTEIRRSLIECVHHNAVLAGKPPKWAIDAFKSMGSMAVDLIMRYANEQADGQDFEPIYDGRQYYREFPELLL